jgi:hypothetical protein
MTQHKRNAVIPNLRAMLVRTLSGKLHDYLMNKVPKLADTAVQRVEEQFRNTNLPPGERGVAKFESATAQLKHVAPDLPDREARAQVLAAVTRLRAAGAEQKVTP